MPRLPLAEPRDGSDPAPLKLFRMVAHAETAYRPWLQYGGALLTRLALDPLLRELAILQVARQAASHYEWVQHDPIARAVGASGAQIDAIQAGRDDDPAFDADQSLVLQTTRTTVNEGAAREEQVAELAERLGTRQVIELLLVIGNYTAIAMLIASTGLEPDAPLSAEQLTRARGST
jgi:4-carboxymuconolactone decarboxylase